MVNVKTMEPTVIPTLCRNGNHSCHRYIYMDRAGDDRKRQPHCEVLEGSLFGKLRLMNATVIT